VSVYFPPPEKGEMPSIFSQCSGAATAPLLTEMPLTRRAVAVGALPTPPVDGAARCS